MKIFSRVLGTASCAVFIVGILTAAIPPDNLVNLPALVPPPASYVYPAKQTLNYAVDWRVFPAGTGTIHIEQQGDTVRINASGETIEALNLLFRVNDRFQSSFNRHTGCSYGFNKQIVEGRRQVNTDLTFDYSQRKSIQMERNLVSGIVKHEQAEIPGCVSDLLSGIFYAASQPIQVSKIPMQQWCMILMQTSSIA